MDFTATSKLLHRWKSLSGYRDMPNPSIMPVVPKHYERLGKERVGRALLPVGAVLRTAGFRQQHHSSVFAKIVPRSGGALMPRGITPRQPARTGRHEGARKAAPRE